MQLSLPKPPQISRYEVYAPVLAHERIIAHEFEIVFHAPPIAAAAHPGQFVELLFGENYAPLVRRPFSLYRVDREAGTCSVLYLARGSFTSGLAQKKVGDVVSVLGPLGRPFQWSADAITRHILIAGGLGAPPLYFLAREIAHTLAEHGEDPARVVVVNGARTRDLLVGLAEFGALNILLRAVTDDGSHGEQARVTDVLNRLLDADAEAQVPVQVYSCGPMSMLRAIGDIAMGRNLPCQLSVETSMPCGIGVCQGCVIPVNALSSSGEMVYARACVDGPVFEARDLVWPTR